MEKTKKKGVQNTVFGLWRVWTKYQDRRPHYHAIIFNYWPKDVKPIHKNVNGNQLYTSDELTKIWGKGYTVIGNVNYDTCAYVARYVMKKAYGKTDSYYIRHNHKQPEFILASRRPGLGYYACNDEELLRNFGVPTNKGLKPLPTYIRKKLRENFRSTYYQKADERAHAFKKILRARETDITLFYYQKNHAKLRHKQLKKLDTRQDFEVI